MFSKPKPVEPTTTSSATMPSPPVADSKSSNKPNSLMENSSAPKPKAAPSVLSTDLTIKGNLTTSGDIQIEGVLEDRKIGNKRPSKIIKKLNIIGNDILKKNLIEINRFL